MTYFIIGLAVGLLVGWNALPQPKKLKAFYDRMVERFRR